MMIERKVRITEIGKNCKIMLYYFNINNYEECSCFTAWSDTYLQ